MRTYKEMAEAMEEQIEEATRVKKQSTIYILNMIDSWIALLERDIETPKEVKKKKVENMLEFIESVLVNGDHVFCNDIMNFTFTYITLRQILENTKEDEKVAQMIHVTP